MKLISLLSYCLICIPGSMIMIPLGMLLPDAVFHKPTVGSVLMILALFALIAQLFLFFQDWSVYRVYADMVCYILLLLPLINMLLEFNFSKFNHLLFLLPTACFIFLFPMSVLLQYQKNSRGESKISDAV